MEEWSGACVSRWSAECESGLCAGVLGDWRGSGGESPFPGLPGLPRPVHTDANVPTQGLRIAGALRVGLLWLAWGVLG